PSFPLRARRSDRLVKPETSAETSEPSIVRAAAAVPPVAHSWIRRGRYGANPFPPRNPYEATPICPFFQWIGVEICRNRRRLGQSFATADTREARGVEGWFQMG